MFNIAAYRASYFPISVGTGEKRKKVGAAPSSSSMRSGFLLDSFSIPSRAPRTNRGGIEKESRRQRVNPVNHHSIYGEPSPVCSTSVPKKKKFRGEMTNHHSVGQMPSQVWSKAGTFLKKWGSCCYTFVSSVAAEEFRPEQKTISSIFKNK